MRALAVACALARLVQGSLPEPDTVLSRADACCLRRSWTSGLRTHASVGRVRPLSLRFAPELAVARGALVEFAFATNALEYYNLYMFEGADDVALDGFERDTCHNSTFLLQPRAGASVEFAADPYDGFAFSVASAFDRPGTFVVACASSLLGTAIAHCKLAPQTADWSSACIEAFVRCVRHNISSSCVPEWTRFRAKLAARGQLDAFAELGHTRGALAAASHCALVRHWQMVRVSSVACESVAKGAVPRA
jgi:hypothetical protein